MAAKKTAKRNLINPQLMDALRDFVRTRGSEFLKDKNISSIGIGYKISDGKPTEDVSVQFTVAKKVAPEALESLGTLMIPKSFRIAGVEVPTDVVVRKFALHFKLVPEALGDKRKRRIDPIQPGVSIGNIRITAGTFGSVVFDAVDGTPLILSNWHVLNGPDGDLGDDIVQPGPHDDNRVERNRVGRLVRSHLGPAGDCAVATIEDRAFESEILDLNIVPTKLGEPELGDKVIKSARTTGVTHGIVTRVHTLTRIDYGGSVGEKEIGGFEIGVDPTMVPANGQVSMGGDSGAEWLFKSEAGQPSDVLAGLHFAGEAPGDPNEHAIACYAKSVFEKLEISLKPPSPEAVIEATAGGFAKDFLSKRIDLPKLSATNSRDAFKLNGTEVIDYTHFSLTMSKRRGFCFWVGWNIDGGNLKKLSRTGIPFVLDPRVPAEFQHGDELYSSNRLDRGHIARRADVIWGSTAEAKKANKNSFFFTNITPQMDDFNQGAKGGLWGRLEDAVFEDVDMDDLKVSVFGGPVLRRDDREFRGVQIPREFWKVIAFVEAGELKAKAFLLTQNLDELEVLDLNQFKVFQVALSEIEARCGIIFSATLKSADSVGERLSRRPEAVSERKALSSLADIDWS